MDRLRSRPRNSPKLQVVEQIRVSPRQLLVLLEVEGERLLLATSEVSAPAFYPIKKASTASNRKRSITIRIEGTCA
jgi:flagellar biogenesis protein FliO